MRAALFHTRLMPPHNVHGLHHARRMPRPASWPPHATACPCIRAGPAHGGHRVHQGRPGGMEAGSGAAWPRRASGPPPAMPARLMGPPLPGAGPRPDGGHGLHHARRMAATACHACPPHGGRLHPCRRGGMEAGEVTTKAGILTTNSRILTTKGGILTTNSPFLTTPGKPAPHRYLLIIFNIYNIRACRRAVCSHVVRKNFFYPRAGVRAHEPGRPDGGRAVHHTGRPATCANNAHVAGRRAMEAHPAGGFHGSGAAGIFTCRFQKLPLPDCQARHFFRPYRP